MISRLSQTWFPVVITSIPRSKSSSASGGVMPKPAAAFSQLAMTRSGACCFRSSGKRSFTIVRPGRPKMSPINRIFKNQVSGTTCPPSSERANFDGTALEIAQVPSAGLSAADFRHWKLGTGNCLLGTDFRRLEKVIISRRIQADVPHPPRVHENVVEVPQVYIRHILRQHFLNLSVELPADILIGLAARLVNQTIDPRIGIETAVRAFGRESVGVKRVLKNIRIFIPADPTQRIKLESAASDIRKKSSKLERANVERNAHIPQLLLEHRRQQSRGFLGGRLHRQVKADAVTSPIAGGVAHLASFLWI